MFLFTPIYICFYQNSFHLKLNLCCNRFYLLRFRFIFVFILVVTGASLYLPYFSLIASLVRSTTKKLKHAVIGCMFQFRLKEKKTNCAANEFYEL